MKKCYRPLIAFFAGTVLAMGASQALAAGADKNNQSLHRDGTAYVKETRITQADRQAAANRAKAKGFEPPAVEISSEPAVSKASPGQSTQANKGVKK